MKIGEILAKAKYRFDLGSFPIPYAILAVSVIGASDKLSAITGISSRVIILAGVPLGVAIIFGLGWILDKIKFPHFFQEEANKRNIMLNQMQRDVAHHRGDAETPRKT
jgi:hypothetical protein